MATSQNSDLDQVKKVAYQEQAPPKSKPITPRLEDIPENN